MSTADDPRPDVGTSGGTSRSLIDAPGHESRAPADRAQPAGADRLRLSQIFEETSDCVLLVTTEIEVLQANASARRAFGEQLVGRSASTIMTAETRRRIWAEGIPALEAGRSWRAEVEVLAADGRTLPVSALLQSHRQDSGDVAYRSLTFRDISGRRSVEIELARQARRDPLTGLPNRLAIMELLVDAQRTSNVAGSRLAVLFIDLDNLKVVNDGLGHGAGDELLVAVARRLESSLRPHDVLGRFGGDEFVVICPDLTDDDAAVAIADRILATAHQMVQLPTTQVQLSASIGIAVDIDGRTHPEDLIRDADTAMYEAKRRGKNRASVFDAALRARVTQRLRLENDLRAALGTGQLAVWFQPVIDTSTFEVRGAEGLVRWFHPAHGRIDPDDFVPLAEETGLIIPLGYEVLATSLALAARLESDFPEFNGLNVGVNVSGRQFADPSFADTVLELVGASGVPVEKVVLELTESVLLDHLDHVDQSLHRLRDAGLQLALDDFGCGYSSLNYLRRYPVNVLKLDTSYTQRLTTEADTRIIAEAITTMADRLGLMVVAEGIETIEHLAVVRELGIARAQGYLLGRPAPGDQLRPTTASEQEIAKLAV
ncbi:MAG: EAL domain-containing protein [Actinomycetota bacterium]|nr:EAL domain-containing protein [Actinomycetota bacterium]